ncbi:LacI family DNA-binding transcriptional regulator [Streptomyces canus]|uniref:LacI family DNA-binding transcriptional regulator n=1 Tax=Streptomyces canus TaxID=58343 RepID=UPI0003782638|nr:LacI family DNA-binding transcriptional regulator [Streptomyces canus]
MRAIARVTLQSIADRLGVSRMTVSNAFSRPDQLSDALRGRILAEAESLGYLGPDPSARSLATGATGAVGVLWATELRQALSDEVSARFLGAVADELAPSGLALTLLPTRAEGTVVLARDVAMDGAIAFSCDPRLPALDWLQRRNLPLVYVDMTAPRGQVSITIDDRGGARAAAQHLVDLGHRKVALVTPGFGPDAGPTPGPLPEAARQLRVIAERHAGWMEALMAAGVEPTLVNQPKHVADAGEGARLLFASSDRPTAALCLTDVIAQAVLAAAADAGLRVPEDLAVVGFDDHPLALRTRPTLTTVRQDVDAKGRAAARALLRLIAGRADASLSRPRNRCLPVQLQVRGSTQAGFSRTE